MLFYWDDILGALRAHIDRQKSHRLRTVVDAEMGDGLTQALDEFAGDPNIRVVIVTGGAPGYFNRHFSIPVLIEIAESLRASGRQ